MDSEDNKKSKRLGIMRFFNKKVSNDSKKVKNYIENFLFH